jgi:hypothetical protein
MFEKRLRLVATAFGAGGAVSVVVVGALLLAGRSLFRATEVAFALGTLAFGFGLLGWSASVMLGTSVETMLEYRESKNGWTEARSRRAMARIGAFGGGLVLASGLFDALVLGG